jgi:DNA replication ATP-dependent helicase Dna2
MVGGVSLYSEERCNEFSGVEIPSGLLYYTQAEEVIEVPRASRELRSLLVRRNDLAEHLMRRQRKEVTDSFLPKSLEDNWACSKCYAVDSCMLYRRACDVYQ